MSFQLKFPYLFTRKCLTWITNFIKMTCVRHVTHPFGPRIWHILKLQDKPNVSNNFSVFYITITYREAKLLVPLKPKPTYGSIVDNNVISVVFWITKNIESFSFIYSIVRHILKNERRFDSLNFMTLKYDNSNHTTL